MRYLKMLAYALLPVVMLAMVGCGSSSTVAADPLAKNPGGGGSQEQLGQASDYKMSLMPGKASALTNEEQIVTATLKDAAGKPVSGRTVYFTITAGPASVLTDRMTTDSNGVALAFIRTGTTSATTNVIVQAAAQINGGTVVGYGNFQVSPGDATQITSKLSLSLSSFSVKPNEQLVLGTTAKDGGGNPLANQSVTFEIAAGPAEMLTQSATTDSNGTAVALIQAGNPASVSNVIAKAKTTVNGTEVTAVIPFQIVPQTTATQSYTMTMVASKSPVDNLEDFYVTATLQDAGGKPVLGQPVHFEVPTGEAKVNTPNMNTDSTGKSIATIRAGNPGSTSAVIIEASTTVNGTVVTALAPVQITTKTYSPSVLIMTLTSDKAVTGTNSDVILKAVITDMQAQPKPVQNQDVVFEVVGEGPATIDKTPIKTDSTGTAVKQLRVGTVNSSSNIVVKASATIEGVKDPVVAYATLQVVRQNSYIINFLTTASATDPTGNLNTLEYKILNPDYTGPFTFKQLVPFQVLDNNGIPKPKVDVSIEVFNYGRNADTVIALVPPLPGTPVVYPPNRTLVTVTTDDHGMGIFTCNVTETAPGPGNSRAESIIYKASATIAPDNINVVSYGGFVTSLTQVPKQ